MKVLIVLTSHNELGNTGHKTGFWLEEFAAPYYTLADAGAEITIATPKGGQPPIDPKSELQEFQTAATNRYIRDEALQRKLANTVKLNEVAADDYDAVFYPGGHGPLWDLVNNPCSIALIETFYRQHKPIAFVCHATAALIKVMDSTSGEPLVKGKEVTGFSNSEEEAIQYTNVVPFLLENELKKLGGFYSKAANWHSYALKDGLLITGQNPASSKEVAKILIETLA
ncbi:type 1 glutamine amidotransferase domain-containing protein [Chitinophaga sp. 30R24]|uniref:type 1 glutamine amidotransferase domain-containing protein n=1 Tax=Chitinophaga sp. 30R24 TaxID=3248838 RepID=UPI003B8EF568